MPKCSCICIKKSPIWHGIFLCVTVQNVCWGTFTAEVFHAFQSPGEANFTTTPEHQELANEPQGHRVVNGTSRHLGGLQKPQSRLWSQTSGGYQTSPTQFPHKWRLPPTSPRRGATTLDQQASIR